MTNTAAPPVDQLASVRAHALAQAVASPPRAAVTGAATRTARVDLYGVIGGFWTGIDTATFVRDLHALDVDEIELHINSPGGSAFDGLAIRNALKQHPARVVVTVDGLAASAASIVMTGGDEVIMGLGSQVMIHDAWGICVGNADDMTDMSARLGKLSGDMARVYARRAGGAADEWRDLMRAETWFSDQECVDAGLADSVAETDDDEDDQARAFDLSIFAYAGRDHAPAPKIPTRGPAVAHKPPSAEPVDSTTPEPTQEVPVAQTTPLRDGVLARLGVTDTEADDDTVLAALDEALTERADPSVSTTPPAVPEGLVLVDETRFAQLEQDAALGRTAHESQAAAARAATIARHIREGAIPPGRRDHHLAQLTLDPEGYAAILDGMPRGLIPYEERGHGTDETTEGASAAANDDGWFTGYPAPQSKTSQEG